MTEQDINVMCESYRRRGIKCRVWNDNKLLMSGDWTVVGEYDDCSRERKSDSKRKKD